MMSDEGSRRFARWLEAESRGDDAAADAALTAVFELVPRRAPSTHLARIVVSRLRPEPFWLGWLDWASGRALVAASLVLVGGIAMSMTPGAWLGAIMSSVSGGLSLFGSMAGMVAAGIERGIAAWALFERLALVTVTVLSTPAGAALAGLQVLVAGVSLCALGRLLGPQEDAA